LVPILAPIRVPPNLGKIKLRVARSSGIWRGMKKHRTRTESSSDPITNMATTLAEVMAERSRLNKDLLIALANAVAANEKVQRRGLVRARDGTAAQKMDLKNCRPCDPATQNKPRSGSEAGVKDAAVSWRAARPSGGHPQCWSAREPCDNSPSHWTQCAVMFI
jgi:hypothetical protein